ncbi:Glycosyl hydrolases family 2, sugar binding domain [Planctomycetes bacterium CA13]|uniref:Glycosyl hydrolases family 2, sugar binding domain n=2 Tax=Novipirellula herctigrandis TaxID=2527986 RepID=A0A5C5Z4P2_9BACT|nr:Glycosyl hydrolases family 2, sugar binding domain [Planctomycetes bacterium CA13]
MDLEAVSDAGIGGIQLFHGKGREWPGVKPQIQTLSPTWDSLIGHVADETKRLGLKFTMQNCPGWAMSGGPWITPDKAMRHLIYSRKNLQGGKPVSINLEQPQPSDEAWRDYKDIAVLSFPTPADDTGQWLQPVAVHSNMANATWDNWLAGKDVEIQVPAVGDQPAWVEFTFADPVTLRSIELPPIEHLMKRANFDPDSRITIEAAGESGWKDLVTHVVPRGTWQDRQPEVPFVMAVPDAMSKRYRIIFHNNREMEVSQLRLSSAARIQDWRAQAGYALRSLERTTPPEQSPKAWVGRDSVVDLSENVDETGRLTWNAPAGNWTVVRFGHVNTGVKNKPAPPEATGFECDKLSPVGAEQHFAGYIGRLSKPGGAADNGRLKGMLIDSWECYTQTWTPAMAQEFEKRRGYSLRTWMPALAGWVVNDHRSSERFLRDWRATISDLIVENYFGRLAELGRERGLELSFETAVGDVSPGDILQYYKSADIPMCEFWQPNDPHDGGLETKPIATTASAAHLYGKPRVAAESFTSIPLDWREHPFALKNLADRSFALGVTHLVFHTYTHNPLDQVPGTSFGSRIGTPFLRGQTWWKHMPHFTRYLARCGSMLEQGKPVADVLWYLGDDVDHKPRQDSPFPSGYHFDYLNADVLTTRLKVDDGDLVNPEGTRWRVLWLSPKQCRRLTPETLLKVKELLISGATVIGQAPELNPSLSGGADSETTFNALVKELWGDGTLANGDRRIGKGRLLWGDDLETSLAKLGIAPDVSGTLPERWCHQRVGKTDIYFVIGDRKQSLNANLHFRAKGKPEFWNPVDGSVEPVPVFHLTNQGTTIPVQLPVAGSTFIVFRPEQPKSSLQRISLNGEILVDATDQARVDTAERFPAYGLSRSEPLQPWIEPEPLVYGVIDGGQNLVVWKDGNYKFGGSGGKEISVDVVGTRTIPLQSGWTLSFPSGWDTPQSVNLGQVQPWSGLTDKAQKHFSGTATYQTSFTLDELNNDDRLVLDLGRVGNIASVKVNGQDAGVLWAAPFRQDVTALLQKGTNTLSIAVTNTWHNRLVYDAALPMPDRKTWTYSAPERDSQIEFSGLSRNVSLKVGKIVPIIERSVVSSSGYIRKRQTFDDLKHEMQLVWPKNRLVRFVFHGHSVPAGYFQTPTVQRFDSYPVLFHQALCKQYPTAVIDVCTTAIGGENSRGGSQRFAEDVLTLKPDVVFIDYCLNDRAIGVKAAEEYWRTMIRRTLNSRVKVVLLTPTPDSHEDILDPKSSLASHAQSVRRLGNEFGVPVVDSYAAFQKLVSEGTDLSAFLSQTNHPNRKGHEIVTKLIFSLFE